MCCTLQCLHVIQIKTLTYCQHLADLRLDRASSTRPKLQTWLQLNRQTFGNKNEFNVSVDHNPHFYW